MGASPNCTCRCREPDLPGKEDHIFDESNGFISIDALPAIHLRNESRETVSVADREPSREAALFADEPVLNATWVDPKDPKGISWKAFDGLYGLDAQIKRVMNYKWVFESPEMPMRAAKMPCLIFEGPPGSGKTDVARRTADAWGVPLLIAEAASAPGRIPGETPIGLQQLCDIIQKLKFCIVLFDDIMSDSAFSQLRQLIGRSDQSVNVVFILSTDRLDRIQRDIVTHAEVVSFSYPDKINLYQILAYHAEHLPLSSADNDVYTTSGDGEVDPSGVSSPGLHDLVRDAYFRQLSPKDAIKKLRSNGNYFRKD